MPGIQFGNQADMNGFKITELAPGTAGTDAVNVNQLNGVVQFFSQTIGNGVLTSFTLTHNFGGAAYVWSVKDLLTGDFVLADGNGDDADQLVLTFGSVPATNQYLVALIGFPA